jgi:metal-responsive CopG/Arc/MetJ family transcriptional regulator
MPSSIRPVGRARINAEQTPARFPKGTLARLDALLEDKEARSDFIREAVEREIERRKVIRDAVEREVKRREAVREAVEREIKRREARDRRKNRP